ncbi:hypothetical protein ACWC10_04645 [Streptomyces sp. NPDC001595]|uniref:hypothetical protein n=1 Tax=Streptomyces sp. NPDC001532 TaxID=3154520 RepID=UPI0033348486
MARDDRGDDAGRDGSDDAGDDSALGTDGHALPYRESTEQGFAETAAHSFVSAAYEEGVLLSGPCPRCGCLMEVALVREVFSRHVFSRRLSPGRDYRTPEDVPRLEPLICTCVTPHENRPEGRAGCGAYWLHPLTGGRP